MLRKFLLNASVVIASTLFAVYLAEIVIQSGLLPVGPLTNSGTVDIPKLAQQSAKRKGVPFDERSVYHVVAEKRAARGRALPALSPAYYLEDDGGSKIKLAAGEVVPLSIAPMASTYYCNESGTYTEFRTDRYGFRNPDAVWDSDVTVVVVGDSFAFGSCLPDAASIVGQIRAQIPTTLNLGMGANGPLVEFAGLREYGLAKKPKAVVWLFFENDLDDLTRERKNRILSKYLEDGFSQDLAGKSAEINAAVVALSEEYFGRIKAVEEAQQSVQAKPWYQLPKLRQVLTNLKGRSKAGAAVTPDVQNFVTVLAKANADVAGAGAKLYFVYLPDCANSYRREAWRDELLGSVRALGVNVIDTMPAIAAASAPYFYCPGSHFSEQGAQITSDLVLNAIGKPSIENTVVR